MTSSATAPRVGSLPSAMRTDRKSGDKEQEEKVPLIPEQEQAGFNRVVSTRTASFVTSTLFYLNKVYKKPRKSAKRAQLVKTNLERA